MLLTPKILVTCINLTTIWRLRLWTLVDLDCSFESESWSWSKLTVSWQPGGGARFLELRVVQVEWLSIYRCYPLVLTPSPFTHAKNSDLRKSHESSCWELRGPDPWTLAPPPPPLGSLEQNVTDFVHVDDLTVDETDLYKPQATTGALSDDVRTIKFV